MKYTIDWVENATTKANAPYVKLSVTDEQGVKTTDVSCFDSAGIPLETFTAGAVVEGLIQVNGKYKNFVKMLPPNPVKGYVPKSNNITKAMEKKEASISKFQDNKEYSIMVSSTFRDATLIALEETKGTSASESNVKRTWLKWRNWLVQNWDIKSPDTRQEKDNGINPDEIDF